MEKSNKKNQRTKRNIIVSAVLAILLCTGIIVGATFALFTSEDKVNVSVTSGNVQIETTVENFTLYSPTSILMDEGNTIENADNAATQAEGASNGAFVNGGTAELVEDDGTIGYDTITLTKMTPGDKVTFDIKVENKSNVAIQYRTLVMCVEDDGLYGGLTVTLKDGEDTTSYEGRTTYSKYALLSAPTADADNVIKTVNVTIELTSEKGNEYKNKSCSLLYKVEAIQANAAVADPDENTLEIYTESDLKWFRKYASTGNIRKIENTKANPNAYIYSNGVKLMNDIDLGGEEWDPINWNVNDGSVFDGNGKTISNFNITTVDKKESGLFGSTTGIHINGLTIDKATVTGLGRVGAIVGHGLCTYIDNCHVTNAVVTAYPANNDDGDKAGAIVGYLAAENSASVTNCTADGCTITASRDLGGLIGHANGTKYSEDLRYGWKVLDNKVTNTTVTNDRSVPAGSHKESEYNLGAIVGRRAAELDESNKAENVTVTTIYPKWTVTPENIQDYLDGKYGSLENATLILAAGNYGKLTFNVNTKGGSNTAYYVSSKSYNSNTPATVDELKNDTTNAHLYVRTLTNLTIKAADDAEVSVAGIELVSELITNSSDPITGTTTGTAGYYPVFNVNGLHFENINFTVKPNIQSSCSQTTLNDVTYGSCTGVE